MALPELRLSERLARSSYKAAQSAWPRYLAEPDHPMRRLSPAATYSNWSVNPASQDRLTRHACSREQSIRSLRGSRFHTWDAEMCSDMPCRIKAGKTCCRHSISSARFAVVSRASFGTLFETLIYRESRSRVGRLVRQGSE